jgi:hypothetical protein
MVVSLIGCCYFARPAVSDSISELALPTTREQGPGRKVCFFLLHYDHHVAQIAPGSATKISAAMSDGRTLLRLLKWLNEWQKFKDFYRKFASAPAGSADADSIAFMLGVLRSLGNGGYFLFDNLMWLSACCFHQPEVGFPLGLTGGHRHVGKYNVMTFRGVTPARFFKLGFVCWLLAIVSQLLLDTYNVGRGVGPALLTAASARQFSKNLADLPIAINGSFDQGWSNGPMGLLGLWSSLVTVFELWPRS